MASPEETDQNPPKSKNDPISGPVDKVLTLAENAVYALVGTLLAVGALIVLGTVGYHLVQDLGNGTEEAITKALDGMLLVFILLELLAAVRATMTEKKLVAEPFLVAGIIAAIKEIIIVALEAKDGRGAPGSMFEDAMTEMGVLGGIVLLLAVAMYLVRRKEREPEEQDKA